MNIMPERISNSLIIGKRFIAVLSEIDEGWTITPLLKSDADRIAADLAGFAVDSPDQACAIIIALESALLMESIPA